MTCVECESREAVDNGDLCAYCKYWTAKRAAESEAGIFKHCAWADGCGAYAGPDTAYCMHHDTEAAKLNIARLAGLTVKTAEFISPEHTNPEGVLLTFQDGSQLRFNVFGYEWESNAQVRQGTGMLMPYEVTINFDSARPEGEWYEVEVNHRPVGRFPTIQHAQCFLGGMSTIQALIRGDDLG